MSQLNLNSRPTVSREIETGASLVLVNGPGKYDLEKALFDAHGVDARLVKLFIHDRTYYPATVNAVKIEDGSGESFLFSGVVYGERGTSVSRPYEAFLRTDKRTGWMKFTAD